MRATNDRLGEKYIVVVARELAKALKGLHAAGIIHRDVKGNTPISWVKSIFV
jgi:serine/threonine protein kinase